MLNIAHSLHGCSGARYSWWKLCGCYKAPNEMCLHRHG